jgi:hypothetical protein
MLVATYIVESTMASCSLSRITEYRKQHR